MPHTTTDTLPLGSIAPDFALPDTEGKTVCLADFKNKKALLVMWVCNHCPYVVHVAEQMAKIGQEYQPGGVGVVAISSNDVTNYPDDSPAKMKEEKAKRGYTFPYLYDETQSVAKAYKAQCTPTFLVFDAQQKLVYSGQMDDTRPKSGTPATGADLRSALDAVLEGKTIPTTQKPAVGCSIKWKPGNAPG
ncbi:MAG: redoxin family protein [Phycisphaera sp.]|nr:redoxin family protein [Phycisphaera sp.]